MGQIKVLIADDTQIAREGLHRLLADTPDMTIVGEACTYLEAIELTQQLHPDVVLLDLKWSGDETAGIKVIQHLRQEVPDTRIIAITVYDHLISRAGEAGAHLAINKDFTRDELHNHIRQVYRSPALPSVQRATVPEEPLVEPLSEREIEVLTLLAEGMPDREIAEQLVIAENTAKNHVSNILSKLGAKNRTHAIKLAREQGLLK